ncbi:MAG: DNA repair protein RecO [Candidatus Gastranaerophilales bacterium]|nr:DNA repair protein RecO [Candidatus Gastranaerophilales bacterium]
MKKSFMTEAINLKNYPLNDNDSIVVMFSKQKGLIRAVAKGVKRPKSKLGARVQMFIANQLMLFEGKNLDTIAQAQSVNTFSKIRSDLDKMSYSMYVAELVNNFCSNDYNKDENYCEIYDLIYATYDKIATSSTKEEVIFATLKFQIKLMNFLGWGLDFEYCSKCQKNIEDELNQSCFYSYSLGSFLCGECGDNINGVRIHNKIRLFLAELSKTNYLKKTKYDDLVNYAVLEKCFLFMKKYIDNLSSKKTKIFEVLEKTMLV